MIYIFEYKKYYIFFNFYYNQLKLEPNTFSFPFIPDKNMNLSKLTLNINYNRNVNRLTLVQEIERFLLCSNSRTFTAFKHISTK